MYGKIKKVNSEMSRENHKILSVRNYSSGKGLIILSHHNLLTSKTVINSEGEFCETHFGEEEKVS